MTLGMSAMWNRWRCWLSGGHDLSGLMRFDDHWCCKCLHDCGYRTHGIPLGEKWERPAPKITRTRRLKTRRPLSHEIVPFGNRRTR